MPAQAAINIGSPGADFLPNGAFAEGGEIVGKWINRSSSPLSGGAEQAFTYFRQKKDGGISARMALVLPVVETVSGVDQVTRVLKATVTFDIPANSVQTERVRLLDTFLDMMNESQMQDIVYDGSPTY